MIQDILSRRAVLISGATLLAASPLRTFAQSGGPSIHVLKDPNCGCCSAWIVLLEGDGFLVTTEASAGTLLMRYKSENGIPQDMVSCHTGRVEGYMIEGHVPAADIRRLLEERPDAVGLAVPGMPYGSPGMGPESEREAYDVFLIRRDGGTEVFTSYGSARPRRPPSEL
ncbi:MAG: putative metal-binding protein [Rhodobacteraceae bacterium HLUCCO07]|nr:MAG: putative metal-binding protein [Rhodobacteraceae bacterium HLUCCO07]